MMETVNENQMNILFQKISVPSLSFFKTISLIVHHSMGSGWKW